MNQQIDSVVQTAHGAVRGRLREGIYSFKGIPYGQSTAGARRFLPPEPPRPWTDIRDAFAFGPRAPQPKTVIRPANAWIRDTRPTGEDCLVLNVYTPGVNGGGCRPVMVYLHGGGYNRGTGSAPGLDGTNLARAGDVVVVTLNHRLGAFGFSYLDGLADTANAGMRDIVAALRWVRDNIAGFGGDAGNVTIFGQSGGGSKVAVAMTMPEAKGLFHKAIIQSASSHLRLATAKNAAHATALLCADLGLARADLAALQGVAADRLLAACGAAVAACNGNDSFRPVIDGASVPNDPFDPDAPDLASDVPLMIGSCETERSFYDITADPKDLPLSDGALREAVGRFVGIDADGAQALIEGYRATHPGDTGRDIYNVITSDHMYRRNCIEAAELKAARSGAPAYLYEFTWRTPALDGMLRTPHTLCIPFVFGNTAIAQAFTGTGPEQDALTHAVQGAWIAFARTGNPNHASLPDWRPYDAKSRPTMMFDNECRLELDPKREDRLRIAACPRFVSDRQWPMAA